jgi:hypothetical protein
VTLRIYQRISYHPTLDTIHDFSALIRAYVIQCLHSIVVYLPRGHPSMYHTYIITNILPSLPYSLHCPSNTVRRASNTDAFSFTMFTSSVYNMSTSTNSAMHSASRVVCIHLPALPLGEPSHQQFDATLTRHVAKAGHAEAVSQP